MDNLFLDSHIHTVFCRHAAGSLDEYAAQARKRGLDGLAITCHSPLPNGWSPEVRMEASQFEAYLDAVAAAARTWRGRVRILTGLECDYTPGLEGWLRNLTDRRPFDYLLGSVHPHLAPFLEKASPAKMLDLQRIYFDHLALAAESGLFHALAHPDVVKSYYPESWRPAAIMDHVRRTLDRIAAAGTLLELNTSGLHKAYPEMNPSLEILREMRARGIGVVIGSDAHRPDQVGAHFEQALDCLREAGYSSIHYCIGGRRFKTDISLARLAAISPSGFAGPAAPAARRNQTR